MRILFGSLLLLFVAATTALIAMRDPGYVLISREPYVLETSLAIFLPLLAISFLVFYYAFRLVSRLWSSPRELMRWRRARRTRRGRESFLKGLGDLAAGNWFDAEKSLVASTHAADSPALANLAAAVAAHGQGDRAKRDRYLAAAREQEGFMPAVAQLLQARLQLADGEFDSARTTLADLQADRTVHAESTRLLATLLHGLQDWPSLVRVLPELRERGWLAETELRKFERDAHAALLDLPLPPGAGAALASVWQAVPEHIRAEPKILAAYARQLLRQGQGPECAQLLEKRLGTVWDEQLVNLYGQAAGESPESQLEMAEEWLTRHGESAALYLTLGRLARRSGRADRAERYLEKSLSLKAGADAHEELGSLYAAAGDTTRALDHCRAALGLCQAGASGMRAG